MSNIIINLIVRRITKCRKGKTRNTNERRFRNLTKIRRIDFIKWNKKLTNQIRIRSIKYNWQTKNRRKYE